MGRVGKVSRMGRVKGKKDGKSGKGKMGRGGKARKMGRLGKVIKTGRVGNVRKTGRLGKVRKMARVGKVRTMGRVGKVRKMERVGKVRKIGRVGEVRQMRRVEDGGISEGHHGRHVLPHGHGHVRTQQDVVGPNLEVDLPPLEDGKGDKLIQVRVHLQNLRAADAKHEVVEDPPVLPGLRVQPAGQLRRGRGPSQGKLSHRPERAPTQPLHLLSSGSMRN
jgi:hypothetical protein